MCVISKIKSQNEKARIILTIFVEIIVIYDDDE